MPRTVNTTVSEPETILSEEEWLEAKRLALRISRGDELDTPERHLAYVRERIRLAERQCGLIGER